MNDFYERAKEKSIELLHEYWIEKNIHSVLDACRNNQVYLIGVSNPNWAGKYCIEGESYDIIPINDTNCVISARLALKMSADTNEIMVDASINFVDDNNDVKISYMHMTKINTNEFMLNDAFHNCNECSGGKYKDVIRGVCDVVLEYSCLNNTFKYDHEEYRRFFLMDKYYITIDQWFWSFVGECVHPEDAVYLDVFRDSDILKRLSKHQNVIETEFRVRNDEKPFKWVKMYLMIIPNENTSTVKEMYILFKDIDEEKTEVLENQMLARTDNITSVWNRHYSEQLINKYLNDIHNYNALIMIDVDNLKNINDIYGKMTGDYILGRIAYEILAVIKPKDILGRFYADCFILFIYDRELRDEIEVILKLISNKTTFVYKENERFTKVKCSMGATLIQEKIELEEIYKICDKALSEAKKDSDVPYKLL